MRPVESRTGRWRTIMPGSSSKSPASGQVAPPSCERARRGPPIPALALDHVAKCRGSPSMASCPPGASSTVLPAGCRAGRPAPRGQPHAPSRRRAAMMTHPRCPRVSPRTRSANSSPPGARRWMRSDRRGERLPTNRNVLSSMVVPFCCAEACAILARRTAVPRPARRGLQGWWMAVHRSETVATVATVESARPRAAGRRHCRRGAGDRVGHARTRPAALTPVPVTCRPWWCCCAGRRWARRRGAEPGAIPGARQRGIATFAGGALTGVTGGYLIGFVVAAALVGAVARRTDSVLAVGAAMLGASS